MLCILISSFHEDCIASLKVSFEWLFKRQCMYKYVFLFAWNHKDEILKKEKSQKKIKWLTHLNLKKS
jgi:hypothetical protein